MTGSGKISDPSTIVQRRRNGVVAMAMAGIVAGMVGLAFAAVPLYDVFCRVTGFGGTTQTATELPDMVSDRVITVRFNADVARDMPWRFEPAQREMSLRVGEAGLAYYRAENKADTRVTGHASFNVTPLKAGIYFSKVACFCFTEQSLTPGQSVDMPVQFFIDPEILDDPNMDDVRTVTLSYVFFRSDDPQADGAEVVAANDARQD
jgi:cytochrome c oxidase assembly protein subunit 11